jgi:hypothetical protein
MHRAGTALRNAAPELGTLEPCEIANNPKQGHLGIPFERKILVVECETDRGHTVWILF